MGGLPRSAPPKRIHDVILWTIVAVALATWIWSGFWYAVLVAVGTLGPWTGWDIWRQIVRERCAEQVDEQAWRIRFEVALREAMEASAPSTSPSPLGDRRH